VSDERVRPEAGPDGGMSLQALTGEILPALIARLRAGHLGELEVRSDGWRVRLRRDPRATSRAAGAPGIADARAIEALVPVGGVARSPAVGYFSPAPALAVGLTVQAGDLLGTIDVLGIAQDVVAPSDGMVASVLAEDGQAVEYGQALAEIDPLEIELEGDEVSGVADA
jgi:biotin carboxyl carrier protein